MTFATIMCGLTGGAFDRVSSAMLLLAHGRIAGVSGLLGRAFDRDAGRMFRSGFLAGLIVTGAAVAAVDSQVFGAAARSLPGLPVAGVLVGIGTTLANGCTRGHGVCGLS